MDNQRKHRSLTTLPISRLFPNMFTIAGLCAGLSAIRFAMAGRWEIAVGLIVAAAIIDGMDGRLARLLKATSNFGAQLDSLADFISFGVAPAVVMHMWVLHEIKGLGWAITLFFAVCTALRLARFNTSLIEDKKAPWQGQFFTGVPSPAGGLLCLLPLVLSLEGFDYDVTSTPAFCAVYIPIIAVLMASRIPTFSGKRSRIRHDMVLPVMLLFGLFITAFMIEPWNTMAFCSMLYLLMIPVSVWRYRQLEKAHGTEAVEP